MKTSVAPEVKEWLRLVAKILGRSRTFDSGITVRTEGIKEVKIGLENIDPNVNKRGGK